MVWAWPFDADADLALVACSLAVLLSLLALVLLVVQELSSPQSLPLHLTRSTGVDWAEARGFVLNL